MLIGKIVKNNVAAGFSLRKKCMWKNHINVDWKNFSRYNAPAL